MSANGCGENKPPSGGAPRESIFPLLGGLSAIGRGRLLRRQNPICYVLVPWLGATILGDVLYHSIVLR